MSESNKNIHGNSGIGFTGLLTIVFITLKLCHVIDWSWWWVLSPIWIVFAIVFAIVGAFLTFLLLAWLVARLLDWK